MRQRTHERAGEEHLEPPPPDSQGHPGVGVEGPESVLRHRAGAGAGR